MNMNRLQTFVHIVEHRCFSEAASLMNLTQSGISRQMKTLEEEVGIQLLNRKNVVQMTPAGRLVYKRAKVLLNEWEQLMKECKAMKTELHGILKIGASTIPGTHLLPTIIKLFQVQFPKVEFSVRIEDSDAILTSLLNKQVDIALVGKHPEQELIQAHRIAQDRLLLVGRSSDSKIDSMEEIIKRPFIVREKGSGTREAMDNSLKGIGVNPADLHYAAEVSSTEAILAMVESGIGIALVSKWSLRDIKYDHISILYELPTERCFYIALHQSQNSLPLLQTFMEETLRIYDGH